MISAITTAATKKSRLVFLLAIFLSLFLDVIGLVTANDADAASVSSTKIFDRDWNRNTVVLSTTAAKLNEPVITILGTSISLQDTYDDIEFSDYADEIDDQDEEGNDEDFFAFLRRPEDTGDIKEKQYRRKTQQSTSTRVNIFQKLGESLGLTIVGCCLIAFMPCLIWKNEGRHVDQLSRIDFCKNNAVAVDCNTPSNETVGRLVHFTGSVTVGDSTLDFGEKDGMLNISKPVPNAIALKRTCYIWQKFEIATQSTQRDMVGGGETRTVTYNLKEEWTALGPQNDCPHLNETNSRGVWDQLLAVTGGAEAMVEPPPAPEEMAAGKPPMQQQQQGPIPLELAQILGLFNPKKPPQALNVSQVARVGEFFLSEKAIVSNQAVFLSGAVPVPPDHIPNTVPGCEDLRKGSDNVLRTFEEGQQPQNGDCKVVYEYVPADFEASFVVAQTAVIPEEAKNAGASYGIDEAPVTGRCNHDLGQIWMVRKGTYNLYEMLDLAKQEENALTMMIRVIGWALLCAGWVMLFTPLITILQVLPLLSQLGYFAVVLVALIVSCLCCCTVMILAYMRYRPVITGGLLVVALGIWGIVVWRFEDAADIADDSAVPTPAPA